MTLYLMEAKRVTADIPLFSIEQIFRMHNVMANALSKLALGTPPSTKRVAFQMLSQRSIHKEEIVITSFDPT